MNDLRTLQNNPFNTPFDEHDEHGRHSTRTGHGKFQQARPGSRDDWEDWDSDEEASDSHDKQPLHPSGPPVLPTIQEAPDSPLSPNSKPSPTFTLVANLPQTNMSTSTASSQTAARHSVQKPLRLKSRARQKAQNAKAGIRLVTDMTKLRKQQQLQLQQQQLALQQQQQQPKSADADPRLGKFVDAAALLALEGKPSDSSIGNWNWLRRRANSSSSPQNDNGRGSARSGPDSAQGLSPNDRPIVIGISLPKDDVAGLTISPQTATLETPHDAPMYINKGLPQPSHLPSHLQQALHPLSSSEMSPQIQLRSVWSPDTEDGSPNSAGAAVSRVASSIYSQPGHGIAGGTTPPVPSVPSMYRSAVEGLMVQTNLTGQSISTRKDSLLLGERSILDDDDDNDTPITLFEEDGSPVLYRRMSQTRSNAVRRSRATTIDTMHSGWWDHVQTPFTEQSANAFSARTASPLTPASAKTPQSAASLRAREVVPAVPGVPAAHAAPALPVMPAMPAILSFPIIAENVAVSQMPSEPPSPSQIEAYGWWKKNSGGDEKGRQPVTLPELLTSKKPELGISTSIANEHGYQPYERSPTIASSSRSAAPAQRLASPRLTPNSTRISEKAATLAPEATPLTGRSLSSDRGDRDGSRDQATPSDAPPPYEPPSRPEMVVRYRAVFPPGHPLRENFPPSPGPVSPGLAYTMTSQGAIHMSDVPLTPAGARSAAEAAGVPFPSRPSGALLPGTAMVASTAAAKVERTRRRHEKEDAVAQRAGNLWRGRGCLPRNGCFGRRGGREGRKRRRLICVVIFGVLALIIALSVVLATTLHHNKKTHNEAVSFWLNTTDFPPIPTGVLTVVGTDNAENKPACIAPSTLWSCSLPKEQQNANQPFSADEPSFVIDIQFDNSAKKLWDVPDGTIPTPSAVSSGKTTPAPTTSSTQQSFDAGFTPQPAPPTFQEMWFLGNTTDGIAARKKAGEPTPFYITFLSSVNASTPGHNEVVSRRDSGSGGSSGSLAKDGFPAPSLNSDGTGAPAVMHPLPIQQPLRLFDRGLPTEHFGFYTYFTKTIYVQSIEPSTTTTLPSDANGGSLEQDANFVVTWLQARFIVKIWTRQQNTTQLLGGASTATVPGLSGSTSTGNANTTQPGTFPYPITITEDLHGGDFSTKGVFARLVDAEQHIQLTNSSTIIDNLTFGGTLINHGTNPTFGGSDGGTGGCKCTWNNFLGVNGNIIE